jgi:hypothetical protein
MIGFLNDSAFYLFALFVPMILLYLLKPKPKDLKLPSLMFIREIEQRRRFNSFFRKIVRDPLLILQLLALSVIIIALAGPFYMSKGDAILDREIAIVLDVSASMQAGDRFAQAMGQASSIVSEAGEHSKVSVVLAKNIPAVALRRGGPSEASSVLSGIRVKDTPGNIGGAMLLATDMINESEIERSIYVISDFSGSVGMDPMAAQRISSAEGISVEFIHVGTVEENIGIIAARSGREEGDCFMEVLIRNFGSSERVVEIGLLLGNQGADAIARPIKQESSEAVYLSGLCPHSETDAVAVISTHDELIVDNKAYAIIPKARAADVLLIKEGEEYLKYALESLGWVNVVETAPPIYPSSFQDYNTIIFQDASEKNILAGIFPSLREFVEQGGNLVVLGFEDLAAVGPERLNDILPVEPIVSIAVGGRPRVLFEHEILADIDISEVSVRKIMSADIKIGAITIAEMGNEPIISVWELGEGKVVYLGLSLNSSENDFHLKPSFPIFWGRLLTWLSGEGTGSQNFNTGELLPAIDGDNTKVRKPSGEIVEGSNVILDEAGFYTIGDSELRIAASLLNEEESDISGSYVPISSRVAGSRSHVGDTEEKINEVYWILAIAGITLLLFEWFYYKRRGSL